MLDFEQLDDLCKDVEQYYEEVIKQVSLAVENSRSIAEKFQYNNLNHNLNSIITFYKENFYEETLVKGIESWEESELSFTKILKGMQAGERSMDRSRQMERFQELLLLELRCYRQNQLAFVLPPHCGMPRICL